LHEVGDVAQGIVAGGVHIDATHYWNARLCAMGAAPTLTRSASWVGVPSIIVADQRDGLRLSVFAARNDGTDGGLILGVLKRRDEDALVGERKRFLAPSFGFAVTPPNDAERLWNRHPVPSTRDAGCRLALQGSDDWPSWSTSSAPSRQR
jgi:hypothetical protein